MLKERAIGYLRAERLSTEALMLSAMRPKGVLLKYKELMREANRDENMLIELENQLKILNLEKARTEDPWKLITKPELFTKPTAGHPSVPSPTPVPSDTSSFTRKWG